MQCPSTKRKSDHRKSALQMGHVRRVVASRPFWRRSSRCASHLWTSKVRRRCVNSSGILGERKLRVCVWCTVTNAEEREILSREGVHAACVVTESQLTRAYHLPALQARLAQEVRVLAAAALRADISLAAANEQLLLAAVDSAALSCFAAVLLVSDANIWLKRGMTMRTRNGTRTLYSSVCGHILMRGCLRGLGQCW